jgi:hypothetical protein
MYALWFVPSVILIGIALRVGSAMPSVRNACLKSACAFAILAAAPILYEAISTPVPDQSVSVSDPVASSGLKDAVKYDFNYFVKGANTWDGVLPVWMPIRIYSDDKKTYLTFSSAELLKDYMSNDAAFFLTAIKPSPFSFVVKGDQIIIDAVLNEESDYFALVGNRISPIKKVFIYHGKRNNGEPRGGNK